MSDEIMPEPVEKIAAPAAAAAALIGGELAIPTPPAQAQGPGGPNPATVNELKPEGVRAHSIVLKINEVRAQHGLKPVTENPALNNIAQNWADHVCQTDNLHHRPEHWKAYPAELPPGGENVLQAWDDYSDAQLVQLWVNSPSHREILLDPEAKTVGTGIAVNPQGKLFAVQNFGR